MLNWADLDPAKVERAAKILLCDLYPEFRSIEGTGGDVGRDAYLVLEDKTVRIFEVKSYHRTLNNNQKTKVVKSLRNALQHDSVTEWVLVMPHDHTPSEEEWFHQTVAEIANPVSVHWWGRAWLDGKFGRRPDLRRYVEGADAQLLQRAMVFEKEQAVLAGGVPDLAARQTGLGKLADELSPHWSCEPAIIDGQTTIHVRGKRPTSAAEDPIAVDIHIGAADPADQESAQQTRSAYERVLAFGGRIAIDRRHLQGVDITASPETAALFGQMLSGPIETVEFETAPSQTDLP
jgi:hypothetical protein